MLEREKWDMYEVGGQASDSETKTEVTTIEANHQD